MSFLHTWNATEMDLTAKSIDKLDAPLLVCKEIPNDMKPPKLKDERQRYCNRVPWYMTKSQGQNFGVFCRSESLPKWMGNGFLLLSCAVLLATIEKQDSEHPNKATWKIHRPRENLLDWNYNLPCNEDNRAHGTPRLLLTPHLWHHFSLRKYEITRVVLEQSFHPGASRVRAVCFILSSLFPTHFLFYCREISELFVISAFGRFHLPSCLIDYQRRPS